MTKLIQCSLLIFIASFISNASALLAPGRITRSTQKVSLSQRFSATTMIPEAPVEVVPTAAPRRNTRKTVERGDDTDNLWEVRVYNDEINTHEWVARCLVVVAGATEWQAYLTTKMAHQEGEAHLGLYEKEIAEVYTEGLREQGILVRMFPCGDFQ